jgi:hypothetical protein
MNEAIPSPPSAWHTPVIVELEGAELEGLLALGPMAAIEAGDGCCALLDVFLGAKLEAIEDGDTCAAFGTVAATIPEGWEPPFDDGPKDTPEECIRRAVEKAALYHEQGVPPCEPEANDEPDGEPFMPQDECDEAVRAREARGRARDARQGEQKPPKFPLIAWPDITFEPDEEWRVEGVLPRVGLACLYGGPGAVKTFILLDLFNRMASGG